MAEYRKEFHWFLLTDYEQEEEFLRRKHQQGQRFVKVSLPGIYYFEDCTPEDVVYRLDFNPQDPQDRDSYRQMYEDYGWTYLQDLNEYSYFCKPAAELERDNQIFSDMESKLEMLKRIFRKRMLPILTIFILCFLPGVWQVLTNPVSGIGSVIIWCLYLVLFALYIGMLVHCAIGFRRLEKKYTREE